MKHLSLIQITAAAAALASATLGHASGYEKSVTWSGKNSGVTSAVTSTVSGAEALYFNPAGLANGTGSEVSANFSPTWATFNAPIQNAVMTPTTAAQHDGTKNLAPVFGLVGSHKINADLGIGIGTFVSGGSSAENSGYDITGITAFQGENKSSMSIIETSIGAGYRILPGLTVGAAWRYTRVNAAFTMTKLPIAGVAAVSNLNDLSASNLSSFRVGAQYAPVDGIWGVGFNYRSKVAFDAKGTTNGKVASALAPSVSNPTTADGTVTASNTFPQQLLIGAHVKPISDLKILAMYSFSNYADDKTLKLSGTINLPVAFGGPTALTDIAQNWSNQQAFHVGVEYTLSDVALRAGYAYVSEVTPKENATSTFSTPAPANVIAFGAGTSFLNKTLDVNLGCEYSWASGSVPVGTLTALSGDYSSTGVIVHTGASYHF